MFGHGVMEDRDGRRARRLDVRGNAAKGSDFSSIFRTGSAGPTAALAVEPQIWGHSCLGVLGMCCRALHAS